MEAEIERLYQLINGLNDKVSALIAENESLNNSVQDLEYKIEDIRRILAGGYEL